MKPLDNNKCFKCGTIAVNSKALNNTILSFNDFGNDAGKRGTTQSRVGKAQLIDCKKCPSCGHSWVD